MFTGVKGVDIRGINSTGGGRFWWLSKCSTRGERVTDGAHCEITESVQCRWGTCEKSIVITASPKQSAFGLRSPYNRMRSQASKLAFRYTSGLM